MKTLLLILSIFIITVGLIPIIKKDNWVFRIFDYPRFQKLVICLALIIGWLNIGISQLEAWQILILVSLVLMVFFQVYQIFPFTPFSEKMVQATFSKQPTNSGDFKVMIINVYQYNRKFDRTIALIEKESPDIFVLVETDQGWADAIAKFKEDYPHYIEKPLDNTYGMLFYSRLPIVEHHAHYLIDPEIPSLETLIELNNGEKIKIFAIHPTPPVPGENPKSTDRDAEILLVGQIVKEYDRPALVIGDLNDVGWSYTSELFLKTSGLLDPRRGRGMFNTFNAKYFFLRWPLDHIFVSKHFTLDSLKVHKSIGSDHFPISGSFTLSPINENEQLETDQEAEKITEEKISNGLEENQQ